MVNIEDFIKRLEILLEYYALNASSFADKIGVQRSSLSHLLSGRNKPSLDFILKILEVFPDVDLYWILNGKGSFPKILEPIATSTADSGIQVTQQIQVPKNAAIIPANYLSEILKTTDSPTVNQKKEAEHLSPKTQLEDEIDKIVIFYKNGTFKSYLPN